MVIVSYREDERGILHGPRFLLEVKDGTPIDAALAAGACAMLDARGQEAALLALPRDASDHRLEQFKRTFRWKTRFDEEGRPALCVFGKETSRIICVA